MVFSSLDGMSHSSAFVHLHVHSIFSYRDGAAPIARLVEKAREYGMGALALTDHNTLSGALRFYEECKKAGVRPILGVEVDLEGGYHLVLLCQNEEGYSNLCRLLTEAHLSHRDGPPLASRDMLAKYTGGLIALSPGCSSGEIASLLARGDERGAEKAAAFYRQLFPEAFYLELVYHPSPRLTRSLRSLVQFARARGLPLVATNNVHYVEMEDYALKELRQAIDQHIPVEALVRADYIGSQSGEKRDRTVEEYLKPAWEMESLFREIPLALKAAADIAEQCQVGRYICLGQPRFPFFPLLEGEAAQGFLKRLAEEGARSLYPDESRRKMAEERLKKELEVIGKLGFETYFLVAWDIARFARERHIRFQVRGSAVNSLVVHCLGISPVDPLEQNLLFERFMHVRRREMPDIDWDLQRTRRDEVRDYLQEKYGKGNVAAVATISTYHARGVAREVGKALGLPQRFVEEVLRGVRWQSFSSILEGLEAGEAPPEIKSNRVLSSALRESVSDRAFSSPSGQLKVFLRLCSALDGFPTNLSVHLGGLVIGPEKGGLTSLTPLQWSAGGDIVSQYDKDDIEKLGLIKMDLIPVPTLDAIEEAVAEIKRTRGVDIDIEAIPRDDPAVFAMHRRSETLGTFQVESPAQREMAARLRPERYDDLILLLALVRPGPMKSRMHERYLRRRHGLEPVTYLHPSLEKVLAETLGQIVYQEQVLQAAHELAGMSYEEADGLRRAMTHERSAEEMGKMRDTFIYSAMSRGVSEEVACQVWKQVSEFASYGFPKGHAVAYARAAYQTLWLKCHYPGEFLAAALSHQPMGYYPPRVLLMEARARGLRVLPPDVNCSCLHYTAEKDAIRIGLCQVRGMTEEAMKCIIKERERRNFLSLEDFIQRVDIARPSLENLIRSGAFSSISGGRPRSDMLRSLPTLLQWKRRKSPLPGIGSRVLESGPPCGLRFYRRVWSHPTPHSPLQTPDFPSGEGRSPFPVVIATPIYRGRNDKINNPYIPEPGLRIKNSKFERMEMEIEALGFSLECYPLDLVERKLKEKGIKRLKDLSLEKEGEKVRVAGAVVRYQSPPVRGDGSPVVFLCLEDGTGVMSVAVFRDVQEKCGAVLFQEEWVAVEGLVGRRALAASLSSASLSLTATALFPLKKYLGLENAIHNFSACSR